MYNSDSELATKKHKIHTLFVCTQTMRNTKTTLFTCVGVMQLSNVLVFIIYSCESDVVITHRVCA
jgi:hypothetical protein